MLPKLCRFFWSGQGATGGVLILGMHRSGTSSLTGSLQQRGLRLGKVRTSNPHNNKGNREHGMVIALNDEVLAASGGAWDSPPRQIAWNRRLARQRDRLLASLSRSPGAPWGFKDPRTVLTLPFWEQGLADYQAVGTFRHPLAVAQSLHARQGMAIEQGVRLWCDYNTKLLELCKQKPFPLVCFDASPSDYGLAVDRIANELGLVGPGAKESFFEESLRHQGGNSAERHLPEECRRIYGHLRSKFDDWWQAESLRTANRAAEAGLD
jgi:hypothetical protein